jgi:hypothetical protein
LRDIKAEIEHLQFLLERARIDIAKGFELWYSQAGPKQRVDN